MACGNSKTAIGPFAESLRPESLHLEINNHAHTLDLIYKEAVRRDRFEQFCTVLSAPVNENGCGLKSMERFIREHYAIVSKRENNLGIRLIGEQAIQIARYGYRLADCLCISNKFDASYVKYIVICKLLQTLRDIGAMLCKVDVDASYSNEVEKFCTLYFRLYALYFQSNCNSTVWTMGYAVPYHVKLLYNEYECGYGVTSMQENTSKHSEIKKILKLQTNRSNNNENGKWMQVLRACWVTQFYLPTKYPVVEYYSHSTHRIPELSSAEDHCACSRLLQGHSTLCDVCHDAENIVKHALAGSVPADILNILMPEQCNECKKQFAD